PYRGPVAMMGRWLRGLKRLPDSTKAESVIQVRGHVPEAGVNVCPRVIQFVGLIVDGGTALSWWVDILSKKSLRKHGAGTGIDVEPRRVVRSQYQQLVYQGS